MSLESSNWTSAMAKLLWERRKQARLSRSRLARLAGISEATIKFVETGRNRPGKVTRRKLLAVSSLELRPEDIGLDSQTLPIRKQTASAVVSSFIVALAFHRIHKRRKSRRITRKE